MERKSILLTLLALNAWAPALISMDAAKAPAGDELPANIKPWRQKRVNFVNFGPSLPLGIIAYKIKHKILTPADIETCNNHNSSMLECFLLENYGTLLNVFFDTLRAEKPSLQALEHALCARGLVAHMENDMAKRDDKACRIAFARANLDNIIKIAESATEATLAEAKKALTVAELLYVEIDGKVRTKERKAQAAG